MPAVTYPTTLPPPSQGWPFVLRERAARSTLPGNPQARPRWTDRVGDVPGASWLYSAAEMAIWYAWWHTTLKDGQLWFQAAAPGQGGVLPRVMRYRPGSLRIVPLGGGHCRVTAELELRGRSAVPQA